MKKKMDEENNPYLYEKPVKERSGNNLASSAVVAAGFVFLTSQLISANTISTEAFQPQTETLPETTETAESSQSGARTQTQTKASVQTSKTPILGTIRNVLNQPSLEKLGPIEIIPEWGNDSAPTGATGGGASPSENVTSPTSATGGGSGSGTTPGNTTSPTGANGGDSNTGNNPGNVTSPTGGNDDDDDDDDDYEEASDDNDEDDEDDD